MAVEWPEKRIPQRTGWERRAGELVIPSSVCKATFIDYNRLYIAAS